MANLRSIFPPAYLKGEHLDGPVVLTIASAVLEDGKFGKQVILSFVEAGYGKLGLNTSNRKAAQKAFGDDTDAWVGKQIKLSPVRVFNPTTSEQTTGIALIAQ